MNAAAAPASQLLNGGLGTKGKGRKQPAANSTKGRVQAGAKGDAAVKKPKRTRKPRSKTTKPRTRTPGSSKKKKANHRPGSSAAATRAAAAAAAACRLIVTDEMRQNVIDQLQQVLREDWSLEDPDHLSVLSQGIEEAIWDDSKGNELVYRSTASEVLTSARAVNEDILTVPVNTLEDLFVIASGQSLSVLPSVFAEDAPGISPAADQAEIDAILFPEGCTEKLPQDASARCNLCKIGILLTMMIQTRSGDEGGTKKSYCSFKYCRPPSSRLPRLVDRTAASATAAATAVFVVPEDEEEEDEEQIEAVLRTLVDDPVDADETMGELFAMNED